MLIDRDEEVSSRLGFVRFDREKTKDSLEGSRRVVSRLVPGASEGIVDLARKGKGKGRVEGQFSFFVLLSSFERAKKAVKTELTC